MNVTVMTAEELDFGTGLARRCVFTEAKYIVEDGDLHVYRDGEGNIAAFPKGSWQSVIRGKLEPLPGETGAA